MNQDAIKALLELLPQIFTTPDNLRSWLPTNVPDGDRIVSNLPSGHVAPAQFFFAAADILRRWGLLGVPEFWDPLEEEAPQFLQGKVAELRARFGVPPGKIQSKVPTTTPSTTSRKINVLLVSASPQHEVRLRVDLEFRNILTKMRTTELRDRINFIQLQAARYEDLRSALLLHKPTILHISSHGDPDGSLRFEPDDTSDGIVPKLKLIKLLRALRDNLRLVILNACHSQAIVHDVPPSIDLSIGMSDQVRDSEAMKFAIAFYEAIGFGRTVENAFDIASADLDDDVVRLFPTDNNDLDKKRQLILVTT